MRTEFLKRLYVGGTRGFVTVWWETTYDNAHAAQEVELRWRGIVNRLVRTGARSGELAALTAAAGPAHLGGAQSQLLVAHGDRLVLEEHLPVRPDAQIARTGPLPHLLPWLAARVRLLPHLLVRTDRRGADVALRDPTLARGGCEWAEIEGGDYPIEKNAPGGWSQRRYQRSADNLWERNAREVAGAVDALRREHRPATVIVAGDVRARTALIDNLPVATRNLVVQIDEGGGRAAGGSPEALEDQVHGVLDRHYQGTAEAVAARFEEERGQADRATAGMDATIAALREGRVETLLVERPALDGATAHIGPGPLQLATRPQDLPGVADIGVDRADAAMVRALSAGAGEVTVVAEDRLTLPDHVGAILRY